MSSLIQMLRIFRVINKTKGVEIVFKLNETDKEHEASIFLSTEYKKEEVYKYNSKKHQQSFIQYTSLIGQGSIFKCFGYQNQKIIYTPKQYQFDYVQHEYEFIGDDINYYIEDWSPNDVQYRGHRLLLHYLSVLRDYIIANHQTFGGELIQEIQANEKKWDLKLHDLKLFFESKSRMKMDELMSHLGIEISENETTRKDKILLSM